jgi:cytosine/adenosine deaminase-related metal-dependent hydrolase
MSLRVEASNAAVGVVDGRIVAATGRFDVELSIADGELRPGLINCHDHLHRNHYGRLGTPPYANAYDWGRDIHDREQRRIDAGRALPRREALLRGAWKNLLAGVTTVVHHDRREPAFDDDFPLRVVDLRTVHSLDFEPVLPGAIAGEEPFAIHLAEGVDEHSAEEIRELDRRGLLTSRLIAVHVVGADNDGIRRLRGAGAAIVWCPTSNQFLFGDSAPAGLLAPGTDVMLGSDSLLTGAGSLLDEIRYARSLRLLSDERLELAVGPVAARRLGLEPPSLAIGARADLVVLRRPLLEAAEVDVALVVAGGELRVLDPALLPSLGEHAAAGRMHTAQGVTRWIGQADGSSGGSDGAGRSASRPAKRRAIRS